MQESKKYYAYWGKVNKEENNYHLLPYHCLDVAAVADAYLTAHPHLLTAMATALGLASETMRRLVLFLITLHDLGKFSICFQSRAPAVVVKLAAEVKIRTNTNYHHTVLGQALWEAKLNSLFIEQFIIWPQGRGSTEDGFNALMQATTGHHGQPSALDNSDRQQCSRAFDERDCQAATQFYDDIAQLFWADYKLDLTSYADGDDFAKACQRLSWWLAGLTVLADWIGSNTAYFKYQQAYQSLQDYWQAATQIAKNAIKQSGLQQAPVKPKQNFQLLFGKPNLRPLQQTVATLELAQHEQLFILEDLTGAGKTEAALLLAYRLLEQNLADGIYFALPTMATANGIYERLQSLYQNFFDKPETVSLLLAHANNKLQRNFHATIGFHPQQDKNFVGEAATATAYCNAWLTDNRKKALLAQVGVGTIDQALLSIIQTKHQALRLIGLFRKVLIVDEVHAYDAYMQGLLGNLLRFHAASGGSAILLSATLTQAMREKLIEEFYSARQAGEFKLTKKYTYPLLTHAYYTKVAEIAVKSDVTRSVAVKLQDNYEEVKQHILNLLNQGQCVCWIRNTVHDALTAYEEFQSFYVAEKITLFHARFLVKDRIAIEDKVKQLFGKDSLPEERAGQLLIATQVVEQSLDLDFDGMVSDLAPIDSLIQRAGRLQRHQRGERLAPLLVIYGPYPDDTITEDWHQKFFPKAASVYSNPAQLWVGAKLLQKNGQLLMPQDARDLIETVYDIANDLQAPECLQPKANNHLAKQRAKSQHADFAELKLKNGYHANNSKNWPEEFRTTTRLIELASATVFFAKYRQGKLVPWYEDNQEPDNKLLWQLSSINIPEHNFKNLTEVNSSPWQQTLKEILEQLPDKGRYSAVLIYDETTSQHYLINQQKIYQVDKFSYSKEQGFVTLE